MVVEVAERWADACGAEGLRVGGRNLRVVGEVNECGWSGRMCCFEEQILW